MLVIDATTLRRQDILAWTLDWLTHLKTFQKVYVANSIGNSLKKDSLLFQNDNCTDIRSQSFCDNKKSKEKCNRVISDCLKTCGGCSK